MLAWSFRLERIITVTSFAPPRKQHSRALKMAIVLALSFVVIIALHWKMQPAVLRAETAYYQIIAHTSPRHESTLLRGFWKYSSHGHYTPLAFTAEFFFAKYAGLHPNRWRARQFFLAGLLSFFCFGFIRAAAEQTRAPPVACTVLAAAVSVIFVAQPLMRNLMEWPFHGLQIGWMILAIATGWALVRLADSENKRFMIWLIAVMAYGSMHVLGLGLAVLAGTWAVLALILIAALTGYFPDFKPYVRTLVGALIFLTVLGCLHTLAMIVLNNAPVHAGVNAGQHADWHAFIGLYILSPIAVFLGLFSARLDLALINSLLHSLWPIGAAVIASVGLFITILTKTSRRPGPRRAALHVSVFSAVMLITLVAMIAMREVQEPSPTGLLGYLVAPRYVLPIAVCWLGLALSGLILVPSRRVSFLAAVCGLLGLGAIITHQSYESRLMIQADPLHGVSHIQVWRNLVQLAREARASNLPIPNLPLESVCGFHFMDFKYLEPLLHDELKLSPNEHDSFLDWAECRDHRLDEYLTNCPTLLPTARLLNLQLPPLPSQ